MIEADDVRRARVAPGLLRPFNDCGLLEAADVHVARRVAALAAETDDTVVLATALAVRAPRMGHVFVDLASIQSTAAVDADEPVDLTGLPWPQPQDWLAAVAASPLSAAGGPLHLEGTWLYLRRYLAEEEQVAADLVRQGAGGAAEPAAPELAAGLDRLMTDPDQRRAAEAALRRRFAVVAGGPGTGKTTTVARIAALVLEAQPDALVALAAPTGKASARLQEAVRAAAPDMDTTPAVRAALARLEATTLHRLLGFRPGSHSRFHHDRRNPLPHDVVIVDETSMVSLTQMARVLEAVRPAARLLLVGDPGQLKSVEAGAVLGDIVGAALPGTVELGTNHRSGAEIGDLADAMRAGRADEVIDRLRAGGEAVTWIDADAEDPGDPALAPVRARATATGRAVIAAARSGDASAALAELAGFRVLLAHRRGPQGVARWAERIENWLGAEIDGGRWYPGRPLLVTENDHALRVYNGDTGVIVTTGDGVIAAFGDQRIRPTRLQAVDTVYAMTVHKAQGSQFGDVAVVLPPPPSPLLTRELLYTGITRARSGLILVGSEATVRAAVDRPAARASGLAWRLRDL